MNWKAAIRPSGTTNCTPEPSRALGIAPARRFWLSIRQFGKAELTSGSLWGLCLPNAAGLRDALFCLFNSLVEDREFLLRGRPSSHCPIKLRVTHIELRFQLL